MELSRDDNANMLNAPDGEENQMVKVQYVCGGKLDFRFLYPFLDCGKENTLDQKSVIRCIVCGHRIFYKKRERKLLQYEAR